MRDALPFPNRTEDLVDKKGPHARVSHALRRGQSRPDPGLLYCIRLTVVALYITFLKVLQRNSCSPLLVDYLFILCDSSSFPIALLIARSRLPLLTGHPHRGRIALPFFRWIPLPLIVS